LRATIMAVDVDGRWIAGIGDPSVVGWVTVAVYAVGAALAARNAAAAQRSGVPLSFWLVLTAVLLALGLNKQLDLQSWFGQTGRDMAISQGWYESRRAVQAAFIALLGAVAVALLVWARRQWAGLWSEYRWVFAGVTLLLVFIVIRAASFHHIDEFIGIDIGVTNFGRALELAGIVAIGAACVQWHAMHRKRVRVFAAGRAHRQR
jgi:hypothetical protein